MIEILYHNEVLVSEPLNKERMSNNFLRTTSGEQEHYENTSTVL